MFHLFVEDSYLPVDDLLELFGNLGFIVGEDCDSVGGDDAVHTERDV